MESSTDADVVPLVVAISAGNRWCHRVFGRARSLVAQHKIDIGGLRYPPYSHNRIHWPL